ncbi:glycosyltransferase [Runella salmonicolor]|uniref:Glycosyltransferase n=1 Tax=Runella salmonicolor TaxID=2950278 RepID=A0ABT1FHF7_9BACT|nr:glycosyltransferase [Runella salmonicolor]MCP1381202.1 glycosyltransferase [Runella salmonicolor]
MAEGKRNILNLSALDYAGAGKFAVDFNDLLVSYGYNSYLVVKDVKTENPAVLRYPDHKFTAPFAKLFRKMAKVKWNRVRFDYDYYFYNLYEQYSVVSAKKILELIPAKPDVIFIHWVTDFLNAKVINALYKLTGAKIYWLMIDNAPITGGCHYPWECRGYQTDCGNCPAIVLPEVKWLAQKNLALKLTCLPKNMGLLVFSESDHQRARQSAVFKHKSIYKLLGLVDENKFVLGDQEAAKAHFGLSSNHKVIFFGAASLKEKRKGMHLMIEAIKLLEAENVTFLIAGNAALPFENHNVKTIGYLNEEQLIKAYQAADIFVCPSIEDSGPMMINQSIMCGTPVVAFNTGVAQDLVHTDTTGYRAALGDYKDLAKGITQLLQLDEATRRTMEKNCRDFAMSLYGKQPFHAHIAELVNA